MHPEHHPIAIIYCIFLAAASALVSAFPMLQEVVTGAHTAITSVLDDGGMRMVCVAGSVFGALAAVGVIKPMPGSRELIFKVIANAGVGFVFTPMIARWLGVDKDSTMLIGVAFAVGLLGMGTLQKWLPMIIGMRDEAISKRLRDAGYDMSGGRPRSTDEKGDKTNLGSAPPRRKPHLRSSEEEEL